MDSISLLRQQIQTAHEVMEGTMADLTPQQAAYDPSGSAIAAGALYAHSILGEDYFINAVIRGGQPLMMTSFAGKSGISEPPPMGPGMDEWAKRVKLDLPALRQYAAAVYQSTEQYLASLQPEDLTRQIQMDEDFGKQSLAWVLSMVAVVHPSNHCGEISCLKGLQGAKGYPF
ncbi:MAG: DinB family protein [Chloroflexi bacterium]|nr:DinB family protein [Chloroflexota bacterium]